MHEQFSRTQMMFGSDAMERLFSARVAVFGVGGVGGYCVEALARAGIGTLDLIDNDVVSVSNINRQIIALHSTVGEYKVDAAARRAHDINPSVTVNIHRVFFVNETAADFDFSLYDYVVDAIDTVTGKIEIIMNAKNANTPVISAMGAGNKLDPTAFKVSDIYKTSVCPLARVMRYELKKRGVKDLKVVYSTEPPIKPLYSENTTGPKLPPGSNSFVPAAAGLVLAGEVIKDLIKF